MLHKASLLLVPALVLAMTISAVGADKNATFTDPEKAGPDFQVQGEYEGECEYRGKTYKYGGQIIALGNGEFHGIGYFGGLPGAGWDKKKNTQASDGQTKDGVTTFSVHKGARIASIKDGVVTVKDGDRTTGTLKKVVRKSPTLGAKPPNGAVVLFDGTTPDAFEKGRMTEDGLLMEGCTSKQKFQNFTIHIEFRTPFKPGARGQGRGNSGFYAQGRYEVQILDSFGLQGRHNECGGVYSIAPPRVNMCFPPLSWQTYDVDFTAAKFDGDKKVENAKMTVRHNGVVVHEDLELPKSTTASPLRDGPEPGPVFFQNHGNPVRFRNIWVVEK